MTNTIHLKEKCCQTQKQRVRTIVTTDGECDDQNSLIRMLFYANDMDLRGIVLTSSCFHYAGNRERGIKPYRWADGQWVKKYVNAYAQIYPNLKSHDEAYPSPEYLQSIIKTGNIDHVNDMAERTPGSELIRKEILREEKSVLYLQCWGGFSTIARALKSIEEDFRQQDEDDRKRICEEISKKLVIYSIIIQDQCYEQYIRKHWPHIRVIFNMYSFQTMAFGWKRILNRKERRTYYAKWQNTYILNKNNPLMRLYHTYWDDVAYDGELEQYQYGIRKRSLKKRIRLITYHGFHFKKGDFLSEGDSPAFLFLLDRGLK